MIRIRHRDIRIRLPALPDVHNRAILQQRLIRILRKVHHRGRVHLACRAQILHRTGLEHRHALDVDAGPAAYGGAQGLRQREAHRTAKPLGKVDQGDHDARAGIAVRHAGVPEAEIAHAERTLGNAGLKG